MRSFLPQKEKKRLAFSNVTLIIFALTFAIVGSYFLFSSHAASIPGDINVDGQVTITDLSLLLSSYGEPGSACVTAPQYICNINGIGGVNIIDMSILLSNYGQTALQVIMGVNNAGSDSSHAAIFTGVGFKWDRLEFVMPSTAATYRSPTIDAGYGLSATAIINTDNNTPLSSISPSAYASYGISLIQANPSVNLWEVGNEMYLKGSVANPQVYGAMFLDLYNNLKNSGITGKTLLFNWSGDYLPAGATQWSQDAGGGGWLHDALTANPGLNVAIANEAISDHPYGGINANGQDESGTCSIAGCSQNTNIGPACTSGCSLEYIANKYLGSIPPIYITEYGFSLNSVNTTFSTPCSSQQGGQAYLLTEAYNIFLSDSHIKGIWWYQADDDSTGTWGLLNSDSSARPSFTALTQELNYSQNIPVPSCNP